jgi:hypothetical protein
MNMKKNIFFSFIVLFLIMIIPDMAVSASPEAIQGLISLSHAKNTPSRTSTIDMQWSEPSGYTGYYYIFFAKASDYTQFTFDETTSDGFPVVEDIFANYNHTGDDTSYYFYIAPVWTDENFVETYGPTSSYGPIIIDKTPPTGSVTISPKPSPTSNVTLSLSTDDAVKMRVSNIGIGEGAERDFATTMPWELETGEGLRTVYVQLKDIAGNTSNISDSVTVCENTSPQIYKGSQQYKNDTKVIAGLSIIDPEGGLLTLSTTSSNLTLIAGSTFSITGLGWVKNGDIYTIDATAGETIPLSFTFNGLSLEDLDPKTISITVTDPVNLSATCTLNIYLKGDLDGNGIVELNDVEKAFYFNAGLYAPSDIEAYIINTVDDGEIISMDDFRGVFDRYIGL